MTNRATLEKQYRLLQLEKEQRKRNNILNWIEGKVNENAVPISLVQHEFQKAIWEDFSEQIWVRKAAQIGVSTIFILKCLYLLERHGYNIIYTLPTLMNDVMKFVPSKVDPIIEKNGIKMDRDSVTQKRIGNGFWFFGGTFSEKEGIMTTADLLVHDELDRSNLDVVGTYKSRLGHSQYRRRWFFSNPSAPKRGVDDGWLRSDQKHWFIKCECGSGNFGGWQFLDWLLNVDYKNKRYVCQFCGREITDEMRQHGEWVKKYPDKDISGYWVSQMMAPWIPCSSLIEDEMNESPAYFNNFVLGTPYIGADLTITRELILRNCVQALPDTTNVTIGVDVGQVLHIVIGTPEGIIKVNTGDWNTLDRYFEVYNPRQCVIDAMPETTKAKEFRAKYPGRVKLNYYKPPSNRKPSSQEYFDVDAKEGLVSSYRTEVIDRVISEFSTGKIKVYVKPQEPIFGGGGKRGESYIEHWESLYLVHDEEKDINTWEHSGADHFAHATVYWWLARQIGGSGELHKVIVN